MEGKYVVVRSSPSGVWLGRLISASADFSVVHLADARRAWSWTKQTECVGLAVGGPGDGSKITVASERSVIRDVCEIHVATESAIERWKAVLPWKL